MAITLRKYGAKYNTTVCTFAGLSTDIKPTTATIDNRSIALANGSEFIEMDTDKKYLYDAENQQWKLASSGGGGGSATLIEKSITENGTYNAADDNADGYSKVTINVSDKTFRLPTNSTRCVPVKSTNKVKKTWYRMNWGDFNAFNGDYIWTDGENIYYSGVGDYQGQYILNKKDFVWEEKTWNGLTEFSSEFCGMYVWTDGENIYYSLNKDQYILDKETDTWIAKTWNVNISSASYIWSDGTNIYYSTTAYQYILNKQTGDFEPMTWNGFTGVQGYYIWTDGEDIYYSNNNNQYVLNKETNTWEPMTWNGFTNVSGHYIWTDGEDIYFKFIGKGYVLEKRTHTWVESDVPIAPSDAVWTDGRYIFLSYGTTQAWLSTTKTFDGNVPSLHK